MKRILLSILCGTVFVIGYFLLMALIWGFFKLSDAALNKLFLPLNLPRFIYQDIFHLAIDKSNWLIALEIISIFTMYYILFYLVFTLFAKITKKQKAEGIETPPQPPVF